MQTTLEESGRHRVKLTVEVPPEEYARDLDRAYRHVAQEVKIPGFRKGKAPKRIIDVQVGREVVLEQFLRESVPEYYVRAIGEREIAPIGDPEIDLERVEDGKPLVFVATVDVRPRLDIDDYRGVTVQRPPVQVSEAEVDEQLDRLRERFAELEAVGRPARRGDYAIIDLRATVHDREVPEASGRDVLYEIGSGTVVPQLDTELEGKRAGEILRFNAAVPEGFGELGGQELTFQVLVKEVKEKRLPQADDDFARMASEFDTLQELRAEVRDKVREVKEAQANAAVRDLVLQELVSRVDVDLPDRLVDDETERRVQGAEERASRQGITLERALAAGGMDQLQFRADARAHATRALKADLVLEAVARKEGIQITREDLDAAIRELAEAWGRDAKEVRRLLERSGQVTHLAGDIIRTKALDVLVEHANVVSPASGSAGSGSREAASPTEGQGTET